jgi:hypothetical protein
VPVLPVSAIGRAAFDRSMFRGSHMKTTMSGNRRRRVLGLTLGLGLAWGASGLPGVAPARAGEATDDVVRTAALHWLAETDAGSHGAAWDLSAGLFRGAVGRDAWQGAAQQVLAPLGPVGSRELSGMKATKSLPGAPDGDYRILSFLTDFAKKAGAIETLTLVREPDGQWRVTGYFVR